MVSQNIQTIQYAESMPEEVVASRDFERNRVFANRFFHFCVWVVVLILCPVFLLAVLNGMNVQKEYELQGIRSQVIALSKENDVMKLEVSKLEAPVRIQQIAETKLKMSLPERTIYGEADPVIPDRNKGR